MSDKRLEHPKYDIMDFVVPGSVIRLVQDYPMDVDNKEFNIDEKNMNGLLKAQGLSDSSIKNIDLAERPAKFLDNMNSLVESGDLEMPDYFPKTVGIIDTIGNTFGSSLPQTPPSGENANNSYKQVISAVLQKSCLISDNAEQNVMFDPRNPQVHNGIAVFTDTKNKLVENVVYRLKNVFCY